MLRSLVIIRPDNAKKLIPLQLPNDFWNETIHLFILFPYFTFFLHL